MEIGYGGLAINRYQHACILTNLKPTILFLQPKKCTLGYGRKEDVAKIFFYKNILYQAPKPRN